MSKAHPLCHCGKFSRNLTIFPYFSVVLSQFVVASWDLRRTPRNEGGEIFESRSTKGREEGGGRRKPTLNTWNASN